MNNTYLIVGLGNPGKEYKNTIGKQKPKRWGIGVQGGVGITPKLVQPYIGIGVSYNLFTF